MILYSPNIMHTSIAKDETQEYKLFYNLQQLHKIYRRVSKYSKRLSMY
jgi:hypothetical protein